MLCQHRKYGQSSVVGTPGGGAASLPPEQAADLRRRLNRVYGWYTLGFVAFVFVLGLLERMGLPRSWIGVTFLAATVALYAIIGIVSRTTDANEYYVAGRRVPARRRAELSLSPTVRDLIDFEV